MFVRQPRSYIFVTSILYHPYFPYSTAKCSVNIWCNTQYNAKKPPQLRGGLNFSSLCWVNASLTEKINQKSGSISSGTYTGIALDWMSYDETQKKILLHKKGAGADSVIPFKGGDLADLTSYAYIKYDPTYIIEKQGPIDYNYSSRVLTLKNGFEKGAYLLHISGSNGIWTPPSTLPSGISFTPITTHGNGWVTLHIVQVDQDITSDVTLSGSSGVSSYIGFDFYTL